MVFYQKPRGKSRFYSLTDWSDNGLAGQFWMATNFTEHDPHDSPDMLVSSHILAWQSHHDSDDWLDYWKEKDAYWLIISWECNHLQITNRISNI